MSYRRQGGYDTAKHLNDLLSHDGYKVSFDIDTLRSGDFDIQLLERIDQCKDFILIVDEHAFERTLDKTFDKAKDWMRNELAYALKKDKNIIPVFLSGVKGFPEGLPDDIKGVMTKNGPEYNRYYFNDFYRELKKRFLHKSHRSYFVKIFIGLIFIIMLLFLFYMNRCIKSNKKLGMDNVEKVDTSKYYSGNFDDSKLFIKGLKRGVVYDTRKDLNNKGAHYTYKCGRVFSLQVIFYQTAMVFYCSDEAEQITTLDYDFDNIGYSEYSEDKDAMNVEYSSNKYLIGQYDIDGDTIDELIIGLQTTEDWLANDNTGIGINVFKLVNGGWMRIAKLNTNSNIQPCVAKMVNNMIYVLWLRYSERFVFMNDSILYDTDCESGIFRGEDIESAQL
nr:toll/interleukin-1 receptor domain-containing protein [Phocaeicola salanitronis]